MSNELSVYGTITHTGFRRRLTKALVARILLERNTAPVSIFLSLLVALYAMETLGGQDAIGQAYVGMLVVFNGAALALGYFLLRYG